MEEANLEWSPTQAFRSNKYNWGQFKAIVNFCETLLASQNLSLTAPVLSAESLQAFQDRLAPLKVKAEQIYATIKEETIDRAARVCLFNYLGGDGQNAVARMQAFATTYEFTPEEKTAFEDRVKGLLNEMLDRFANDFSSQKPDEKSKILVDVENILAANKPYNSTPFFTEEEKATIRGKFPKGN